MECNVCFDDPKEDPIVTICGHLFCSPCLNEWLDRGHHFCPVCKGLINVEDDIIPIYCGSKSKHRLAHKRGVYYTVCAPDQSRNLGYYNPDILFARILVIFGFALLFLVILRS
jgi:Zinc finger, C3HC4 type (RING finger)